MKAEKAVYYRLAKRYLREYNYHTTEIPTLVKILEGMRKDGNEEGMRKINNDRLESAKYFYNIYKNNGGKRTIKELEGGN